MSLRFVRELKVLVQMGCQMWSEDIEMYHVLHTHDALAMDSGSKCCATRIKICHGHLHFVDLSDILKLYSGIGF